MTRTVLRAAVIGVGSIGLLHARVYCARPETRLVAVVDADGARARSAGEELDVAWFTDVEEMLGREAVDVVSIATPEDARLDAAAPCVRAGTALLLEKPLGPTLDQADELIDLVERSGAFASVNFILRSDLRFATARRAIADGEIGDVCAFTARRRGSSEAAARYDAWTDLVLSTAVHDLDAMVWLGGSPVERVRAEGSRRAGGRTEDVVATLLRFADGAVGMLETSWVLPPSQPAPIDTSFHVLGTRGAIFIDGANHGLTVLDEHRCVAPDLAHWHTGPRGVTGALAASLGQFVDAVAAGEPPPVPLHEAREIERVAAAIKRALQA